MIERSNLFLLEIYGHLGYLLLGWHQLVAFPLLTHLQDLHFADVIVIVEVVLGSINAFGFILHESHAPAHNLVIPILIEFGSLLSDFLDAFDEPVMVAIGVVGDDAHSAIYFDDLFPVR